MSNVAIVISQNLRTPDGNYAALLISGAGDGSTGGGLCTLENDQVQLIDRVSTAGITIFDRRLARLLRAPLSTGGGEILIYDQHGICQYLRIDELSDAHYMAWDGYHLVVSSTGTNRILWIDMSGRIVRHWEPPETEDDAWHLNDVLYAEGRLYACAFGRYSEYRGYKKHLRDGHGFVFDVETGKAILTGLCAPHSPRYVDPTWLVCNSQENALLQFDAAGRLIKEAKLQGFTRGLAISDEYVIVGESAHRTGEGVQGSVTLLRREDFGFVARFHLPFPEISEIALVPAALVQATRIGFRTNLLRTGESDQLQLFRSLGQEPKRLWAIGERLLPYQCRSRIDANIPCSLMAGKLILLTCCVHNLSEAFFCSELPFPVFLSYRWKQSGTSGITTISDGIRTRLPSVLPPGSSIRIRMEIQVPDVYGEYVLSISLVQEQVVWFDDLEPTNARSAHVAIERGCITTNHSPRRTLQQIDCTAECEPAC